MLCRALPVMSEHPCHLRVAGRWWWGGKVRGLGGRMEAAQSTPHIRIRRGGASLSSRAQQPRKMRSPTNAVAARHPSLFVKVCVLRQREHDCLGEEASQDDLESPLDWLAQTMAQTNAV